MRNAQTTFNYQDQKFSVLLGNLAGGNVKPVCTVNTDWFLLVVRSLALFGNPYKDMVCGSRYAAAVVAAFCGF